MSYRILTRDEHFQTEGPKRILALDGGGLRGILTLGLLRQIESTLRSRHGDDPGFRLCHYFDLIAGTSTGAIIAAALAMGMTVEEVIGHYQQLGRVVFAKGWFRQGIVRARYDEKALIAQLKEVFGKDRTLADEALKTGLLIMTKRIDTGSPWPLGNNPRGRYFKARPTDTWISNGDYPLWKVVRASTAAPTYFEPEAITVASETGKKAVIGTFVDGGVSPFNNPSLQAFLYTTLDGYRINWKTGPDQMLLVSVGTGAADPRQTPSHIAAKGAIRALFGLMDDCAALVETMMQWVSSSPTARTIDREIGDLSGNLLGGTPLLSYLRYNVTLSEEEVRTLQPGLPAKQIASLSRMDVPGNLDALLALGVAAAAKKVKPEDFPTAFNLKELATDTGNRLKYVKRANQAVVAVQLTLDTTGFTYQKWGGDQKCKQGDWIVNNDGDVYTVDSQTFQRTYRPAGRGAYIKTTPVWAEVASEAGSVETKEGKTHYRPGDYLVFNQQDGGDAYAISAAKFESMYERAD